MIGSGCTHSISWYQSKNPLAINTKKDTPFKEMVVLLNLEEGQSSTRPPRYNGQFYGQWKTRMHDYMIVEDSELWYIVLDGHFIQTTKVKDGEITRVVLKTRQQYNEADRRKI